MATGSGIAPIQPSYLAPPFERATVADAMRPGLFSCPPDTPLDAVARMMATYRIHAVVVSALGARHEEASAWGIVSDRDLARFAGNIAGQTAASVASTDLITVSADDSLERAAKLMADNATSHLVVVERGSGHPVGVLSTLDVAAVLAWSKAR